ncbi:MAG: hypothetical protein ACLTDA_03445 [[Eubacterium] siraeum]
MMISGAGCDFGLKQNYQRNLVFSDSHFHKGKAFQRVKQTK